MGNIFSDMHAEEEKKEAQKLRERLEKDSKRLAELEAYQKQQEIEATSIEATTPHVETVEAPLKKRGRPKTVVDGA